MSALVPVVIPSYEPDERFPAILRDLVASGMTPIVVVDDGSGEEYSSFFAEARSILGSSGVVLTHEVNKGKGRALKTAFSYILENYPSAVGCITADSDGQHTAECISNVRSALVESPSSLVLGVRKFDGDDVPWKSRMGNNITIKVVSYVSGLKISDTQTGLRGIPLSFMRSLLSVPGERFEFETKMLLETVDRYPIVEVPIKTVYDSKDNHTTHFDPWKDSWRIYKMFGWQFLKYAFSSGSSCLIDIFLFWLFCKVFSGLALYIAVATVLARVISATYNFLVNYKLVFSSKKKASSSVVKYFLLALCQMGASALLVSVGCLLLPFAPEVVVKLVIDSILFFMSYYIQRRFVF